MRKNQIKFKNRKNGFSLMEIIVFIGVLSISMVLVTVGYSIVDKSKISITEKIATTEFISALSKHLTSQAGCVASLVSQTLPTPVSTPLTLNNYKGYAAPTTGILTSGTALSTHLKIQNLSIQKKAVPPHQIKSNGITYERIVAQIKIVLNIDSDNTPFERFIELPVLTKITPATGTIDSCENTVSASTSESCVALGGTFTPPNTCTPSSVCRFMGIAYGCWPYTACTGVSYPSAVPFSMASLAATVTPPVTVCSKGGTPTSTGQSNYTFVAAPCGKYGCTTYSNTAYLYVCLECP